MTKHSPIWIACFASAFMAIMDANVVRAQDAQQIENLRRNILAAQQTLQNLPELTRNPGDLARICEALRDQQHFFHVGHARQGKRAVLSFAEWEAFLNREVAAGRATRAQADQAMATAKQRRNEVLNACALDYWNSELAKARQPAPGVSGPAKLVWNQDAEFNEVINADGTITGNAAGWQFTGTGTPTSRPQIVASVTCSGQSVGLSSEGRENGTLSCRAEWNEGARRHIRQCSGPGAGRAYGYNATKAWFVAWPRKCVGSYTGPDGRPMNREFGYMIFPVLSQASPFNF